MALFSIDQNIVQIRSSARWSMPGHRHQSARVTNEQDVTMTAYTFHVGFSICIIEEARVSLAMHAWGNIQGTFHSMVSYNV